MIIVYLSVIIFSILSLCHSLLIVSVCGVWRVAAYTKYLSQIDRLQKREFRFGYIQQVTPIQQIVKERDLRLWNSLVDTPSHPL